MGERLTWKKKNDNTISKQYFKRGKFFGKSALKFFI